MINKKQFQIKNNKKLLHKIGKKWVIVSALTLALLGAGSVSNHIITHADTNPPRISNQRHTTSIHNVQSGANSLVSAIHNHQASGATSQASSASSANVQPSSVASHAQLGSTILLSAPQSSASGTWDEFGYINMMTGSEVPGVKSYEPSDPVISGANLDDFAKDIPGCKLVMGGHAMSDDTTPNPSKSVPNTYMFVYTGTPNGKPVTMPKLQRYLNVEAPIEAQEEQPGTWDKFHYISQTLGSDTDIAPDYTLKVPNGTNLNDFKKIIPGCKPFADGNVMSDFTTSSPSKDMPNIYTFVYTGVPNGQPATMPYLPNNLKPKDTNTTQPTTKKQNNNNQTNTQRNNQNQRIGKIIVHYINATKGEATYGKDIIPPKVATGHYSSDSDEKPSDMFHMDNYVIQYLYKNNSNDKFHEMTDDQVSDYIHNHSDTQHYQIGYSAQNEGLADSDVVSDVNGDSNYGKNNFNLNTMTSVKPMFFQPYDQNVYVYFTRDRGYIQVQYSDELTHQQLAPTKNFSDVTGAKFNEHPYAPKEINGFHLDTRYLDAGYDPNDLTQFSDSQPNDGDNHVKKYSYLSYLPNVDHVDYRDKVTGWLVGQWKSTRPSDVNASNYDSNFMMFNHDFQNSKYDGLSNGYEVLSDTASDYGNQFDNDIKKDNDQYHYGNYSYTIPVVKKSFIDVKFFDATPDKNGNHAYLGHHQVWSYENQPFDVNQYSEFVPKGYSAKLVNNMPKLSASVVRDNKYANDGNPSKFLYDNQIMGVYVYKKAPVKATNTIEYIDGKKVIKTLPKYIGDLNTYDSNINGEVINSNLPNNYQLTKPINSIIPNPSYYDNSIIKVPIKVKEKTKGYITIKYIDDNDTNNNIIKKLQLSETIGTPFDPGSYLSNLPVGYEYKDIRNSSVNHFNANAQTVNIYLTEINPPKLTISTITIDYKDGNQIVGSKQVSRPVSTDFDIGEYLDIPNGYQYKGIKNDVDHFDYNNHTVNVLINKVAPAKVAKSTITINYISGKKVVGSSKTTEPVLTDYDVGSHLDIPNGYEYVGMQSDVDNYNYSDHTINVLVNKAPNPKVVQSTITVKLVDRATGQFKKIGSDTEHITTPFDIGNYLSNLPAGYEYVGIKGNVTAFDYNNHTVEILVNKVSVPKVVQSTITVNYVDKNGKLIQKAGSDTEKITTPFDIDNYLSNLPNGYEYAGIKNSVSSFDYDNHTVDVILNKITKPKVTQSTIIVNFINKNTSQIVKSIKIIRPVSTDFDTTSYLSNIPSDYGYSGLKGTTDHFTYDNQTVDIYMIKTPQIKSTSSKAQPITPSSAKSSGNKAPSSTKHNTNKVTPTRYISHRASSFEPKQTKANVTTSAKLANHSSKVTVNSVAKSNNNKLAQTNQNNNFAILASVVSALVGMIALIYDRIRKHI